MSPTAADVQSHLVEVLLGRHREAVGVLAGEELTVAGGATVRLFSIIEYRGPATTATLYGAIGNRGITFDEVWAGTAPTMDLPESVDWKQYILSVDVLTDAGQPGLFDVYVKLLETGAPGMPEVADGIRVLGAAEFRNFAITSYEKVG